mgnify:CR=1 FL=1
MHIHSADFVTSAPALKSCPAADWPEIAFAGRSNVGKSSLINAILGSLDPSTVTIVVRHTTLDREELLRIILHTLYSRANSPVIQLVLRLAIASGACTQPSRASPSRRRPTWPTARP